MSICSPLYVDIKSGTEAQRNHGVCGGYYPHHIRMTLVGFLIELYGIFVLYGDFFATVGSFAGNIPVAGPFIQKILDRRVTNV